MTLLSRAVGIAVGLLYVAGLLLAQTPPASLATPRIEELRGKSVLVFTPHPDDDTFCCAGTLAMLVKNGNQVRIVIYTNDDKGSYDPEMTSERLARIRKAEEEEACRILGIPKENITWLQFHDGMLEYASPKDLVEQATGIIRKHRPELVIAPDPGGEYVRWHKTDHRMAANATIDAIRAAEWHLYFPNQRLHDGLQPWRVPMHLFYYAGKDANYEVNIDEYYEKKLDAAAAHVSQWEPSVNKYRPTWEPADLTKLKAWFRARPKSKDGHRVESFRFATEFNQQ
jgi:LmbE family N-acetylglucosaminyl deacetylase